MKFIIFATAAAAVVGLLHAFGLAAELGWIAAPMVFGAGK